MKCKWVDVLERMASQSRGKNVTQFSSYSQASRNFCETTHPLHHSLGFNRDTISLMHSFRNSGFEHNRSHFASTVFFFSNFLSLALSYHSEASGKFRGLVLFGAGGEPTKPSEILKVISWFGWNLNYLFVVKNLTLYPAEISSVKFLQST